MKLKGDVMEMKYVIRLLGMEINNIKNVIHGEIEMPQNKKGSILGIYGANGSGKTVACGLYGIAEISSFWTSDPVEFLLLYK